MDPLTRKTTDLRLAALFATGTLILGLSVASIGYAIGSVPDAGVRRPPIYPLDWMFWAVWFVLYPATGMACYHLWCHRRLPGSGLAWRFYLLGLAANLTWVPIVHLTHSPVAGPAIMDAIAGALMLPALWAIGRSNRPAFLWCIPLLLWGPFTGSLKIWQLLLNQGLFTSETWRLIEWSIYVGGATIVLQLVLLSRGLAHKGIS